MKVAVLGVGGMGESVIGHLKECSDVSTIVCFDTDSFKLEKVRASYSVSAASNLETILEDDALTLVFITAANSAHSDLALASLRAGKHVMLEKPIATTFEESQTVIDEASRLGAFLQVGFELRYSTLYTTVKEWIDRDMLGAIVNVNCNYICSEFHKKGSWRNMLETGGSMCGEKLSHYLDLARWWIKSEPREVFAVAAPNVVPYFEVKDNYHITCRFHNGAVSHMTFMMFVAETFDGDPLQNPVSQQKDDGHELRMMVVGTDGAAETDVFRRRIRRWRFEETPEGLVSKLVESITWGEESDHSYFHNTEAQTRDIVSRVLNGLPPKTSGLDAIETMRFCDAVDLSVEVGERILLEERELHQPAATSESDRLQTI